MPRTALMEPDRYFAPDASQRRVARELYDATADLPIVSPHGHVDPRLLADENATFGTPADLFIIPDHYVFRMLYSQGVPLEALGIPRRDGSPVETDHRKIWQTFSEHFYLFRGTPSGLWLAHGLHEVFGIRRKLDGSTAQAIYDELVHKLAQPEYRPRALFDRFRIEVLCTTDGAADSLEHHRAIRESGWRGVVRPTFRPDGVANLLSAGWRSNIDALSAVAGCEITTSKALITALQERRAFFKSMGAASTDSGVETPYTEALSPAEAERIFARALAGKATIEDARRFTGYMAIEMARMSTEDGLVMQFHAGCYRNHNPVVFGEFGADKGHDIPVETEWVRNLKPLTDRFGNDPRLTMILFTMDETSYSRELAPLAGHYPALRLGPPWWFQDSPNGMARYFDQVMETAGIYNTVGFIDDTRAFLTIPARHDLWRRASANWLAGLVVRGLIDRADAEEMAPDLANGLARRAFKL
ncbi:MAG TPA: glucuronate isomerase [Anaerolineae bacterium]|nr:glucuronate isomerase [Anaerolineae bacterium]